MVPFRRKGNGSWNRKAISQSMAIDQLSSVMKSQEHRNKQNRLLRKQMGFGKV